MAEHGGEREQHRDPGGDERAERDHEDHQRDRQRERLAPAEVVLERFVERLLRAGVAELLDAQARVGALRGAGRGEDRARCASAACSEVALDLELDERRATVLGQWRACARRSTLGFSDRRALTSRTPALELRARALAPWLCTSTRSVAGCSEASRPGARRRARISPVPPCVLVEVSSCPRRRRSRTRR